MSTQIISDYIRRWGFQIGLVSVLHLIASVGQMLSPRHTLATPILLLMMGPIFLSMDLAKGLARPLLLLPIERQTLAKTWWSIGVGLPTLWGFALLLISAVIASFWAPEQRLISDEPGSSYFGTNILVTCILSFSSLSFAYFALTGLPTNVEDAKKWSGKNGLFGALWGFSIGGSMMLATFFKASSSDLVLKCSWLLFAGIGFTVWGYRRTENMLTARSTGRPLEQSTKSGLTKPLFEINSRQTGFNHFTQTTIAQVFCFAAFFFVAVTGIQWFVMKGLGSTGSLLGFDRLIRILEGQAAIFVAMPFFYLASKLTAARVFRTLPITAKQLTNQLFKLAAILICIQAACPALLAILTSHADESLNLFCYYFFVGGLASISIPIVLRWGLRPITFGLLMPIFVLNPLIRFWLPESSQSLLLFCFGMGVGLVSKSLTERIFSTSSDAYRPIQQNAMNTNIYGRG